MTGEWPFDYPGANWLDDEEDGADHQVRRRGLRE